MMNKADTYCGKCIKADVCGMEDVYDPATTYCAYRVTDRFLCPNEDLIKMQHIEDLNLNPNEAEKILEPSSMMQKIVESFVKAEEELKYKELRDQGIISDVVLVMNSEHKGVIEQALYSAGIKKIPIIYVDYVEIDKAYAITDKNLVENIKKNLNWEEGNLE